MIIEPVLLAMAIMGLLGVVGVVDLNSVRVAGARTSMAQRRWALGYIRAGHQPGEQLGGEQVALVRAVAAGRGAGVSLVLTFAGTTFTGLAAALDRDVAVVLALVAACASLAVAVALGVDLVRARQFLTPRPKGGGTTP